MKFIKSKFFILTLTAAILLTLIPTLLLAFGGTDLLRSVAGTVAQPFTYCASGVANAANGFVQIFTQYDDLKKENAELKEALKEYENKEYNEEILQERLDWIEGYLNVHNINTSLIKQEAKVISRQADSVSTMLTLDCGSIHGIKVGMPVITADGLLGYVDEVGPLYCKVSAITKPSRAQTQVYTDRNTGTAGYVTGTTELYAQGLCQMTVLESKENLQIGDRVYTAATAEHYRYSGIPIGTVSDITLDSTTGKKIATIKPHIDFEELTEIRDVMIICSEEQASRRSS